MLGCYECQLEIHGEPKVSWTRLRETAYPGSSYIKLEQAVDWNVGSKIVIATTDFESPVSSHSEVATVAELLDGGSTIRLEDITSCPTYSSAGKPTNCRRKNGFSWIHLGESRTFDNNIVDYRAEVGLLTRNVVIQGDYDEILCPSADLADDGITRLSCNQHGAQLFFHSPGPDSLVIHLSNVEIRNAGQAFRLGRYAIHYHMIGDLRQSYQRNCSIHHSWNRGTAVHGVNYLVLEHNFVYNIMGHAYFVEDGVEQFNFFGNNLGIKILPSMSLLNTDQVICFVKGIIIS